MDSTSIYGLELIVLEGTVGKALATDHRDNNRNFIITRSIVYLQFYKNIGTIHLTFYHQK